MLVLCVMHLIDTSIQPLFKSRWLYGYPEF
jgi:hypothetical protein